MKKLLCALLALCMVFAVIGCSKMTTAERFDAKLYEFRRLDLGANTRLLPLGEGKLLAAEPGESNIKLYIIDISAERVIKKLTFKPEKGYRYELLPQSFAEGRFVLEAFETGDYDDALKHSSFFMLGSIDSKQLTKLSTPSDGGIFNYDCTKYYFPVDNEIQCLDIASNESKLAASFNAGSVLNFEGRLNDTGSIHALRVNPDGGDSYLCRFELESGTVSNPIYQSALSLFVGGTGDYTALLMLPDDQDILSLQLYLVNSEGHAGSDTIAADLGSAFSTKSHTVDTGYAQLWGSTDKMQYLAFLANSSMSSTDKPYTFRLGKLGSEFAEFADLTDLGEMDSIYSSCYSKLSENDNNPDMALIAAVIDGRLCIINPEKLDYTTKILLNKVPYADLIANQ